MEALASVGMDSLDSVSTAVSGTSSAPRVPDGWLTHVHPEGWIYFSNPTLRVVTQDDIRQPDSYRNMTQACSTLPMDELDEMKLEVYLPGQSGGFGFFNMYIDHQNCLASYSVSEVKERSQMDIYMKTRCERFYWTYIHRHCSHVPTPARAHSAALDALTWYFLDNIVSAPHSNVPFSKAECEDLLRMLRDPTVHDAETSPAHTLLLAWILREVYAFRVAIGYGLSTRAEFVSASQHKDDMIKRRRHVHRTAPSQFLLGLLMNGFCFGVPWAYLAQLKNATEYRGRLSNLHRSWGVYVDQLVREYSDFVLIATVLLSATIGFLALPSVENNARSAAIISVFGSLGSITVGAFCVWRHRSNMQPASSYTYLYNAEHAAFGLHGHAMLLSLPLVLLVWALAAFAIAMATYATQQTFTDTEGDRVSTGVVIGATTFIFTVVALALYTFTIAWKWQSGIRSVLSSFRVRWMYRRRADV